MGISRSHPLPRQQYRSSQHASLFPSSKKYKMQFVLFFLYVTHSGFKNTAALPFISKTFWYKCAQKEKTMIFITQGRSICCCSAGSTNISYKWHYHLFIHSAYTTRILQPILIDDTQNMRKQCTCIISVQLQCEHLAVLMCT